MGKTNIQWTAGDDGSKGRTWNITAGCTRVSSGCDHCYAFSLHTQRYQAYLDGWEKAPKQYHMPFNARWHNQGVQLLPERLIEPLHWKKPSRVFVDSMSDLFHESVPEEFIRQAFQIMGEASQHTFQVLTKRPERMQQILSGFLREQDFCTLSGSVEPPFPWPNVWVGTSVENQQAAEERIPALLQTPAALRFLSCEPLLGPLTRLQRLPGYLYTTDIRPADDCLDQLDWVIIGGESGTHARPMQIEWVESIIEQCRTAGVAVFVKQLGSVWAKEHGSKDRHGATMEEWPEALQIRAFPNVEVVV